MNSSQAAKYWIAVNLDSEQITRQICAFLINKILKGFNKVLLTGMTLIGLQEAFDTVNHEILFKKFQEQCT